MILSYKKIRAKSLNSYYRLSTLYIYYCNYVPANIKVVGVSYLSIHMPPGLTMAEVPGVPAVKAVACGEFIPPTIVVTVPI